MVARRAGTVSGWMTADEFGAGRSLTAFDSPDESLGLRRLRNGDGQAQGLAVGFADDQLASGANGYQCREVGLHRPRRERGNVGSVAYRRTQLIAHPDFAFRGDGRGRPS